MTRAVSWDHEVDLLAIGSGAAGLSAVLTAADKGARVMVVEATQALGGTTAFSGALLWVPGNRYAREAGFADSRAAVEAYIKRVLGERAANPLWQVFLDHINPVIDFLADRLGIGFTLTRYPDSYGEWPEGRTCRHIEPTPFSMDRLGEWKNLVRSAPMPQFLLIEEVFADGAIRSFEAAMRKFGPIVQERMSRGERTGGGGFVGALLKGCLDRGVQVLLNTRVVELLEEGGRIVGVHATQPEGELRVKAHKGVVLACGGFDWNEELKAKYLPGPIAGPQSPPVNLGDNITLAEAVGAQLAYLDEAWYLPTSTVPGLIYEGKPNHWPLIGDRIWPHNLWVNAAGKRFVNESGQNTAEALYEKDPATGILKNLPCWCIFDQQYRDKYSVLMTIQPGAPDPDWLIKDITLRGLAMKINVDADGLEATIARFNTLVRAGKDEDFGRGDGAYEGYFGDREAPHPCLGTVEKPPYYAVQVITSGVGTKGGAKTNANGQVLNRQGAAIPGLYAAGNAAANFNGPRTVAAGCTIPPALVMGYLSALHALRKE
jgi:succinate dehydrogenase/fumarate reductase flavoprotein subunit